MNTSEGILYIAFGEAFRSEALLSISSVKEKMPGVKICLMTDEIPRGFHADGVQIKLINPSHLRAKVDFIAESPFQKTIYLDSDTLVERDISELFELLDRFDVVAAHDWARKRKSLSRKINEYGDIPYAFSEVNGGVFGWKSNAVSKRWIESWKELYYTYQLPGTRDQATLRISLWSSGVSLYILPPEFNLRGRRARAHVRKQKRAMGKDHLKPRVIHLHAWESIHRGKIPPSRPRLWRLIMRLKAHYL